MLHLLLMKISSTIAAITRKLKSQKLLVLLIIGFGILLYIIDLSSLRSVQLKFFLSFTEDEEDRKWDWKFVEDLDRENQLSYKSYFVDTDGCRMPSFNITDKNIEKYVFEVKPIRCGKALTRSNNRYLWIDLNETEIRSAYGIVNVKDLLCKYEPFRRKDDFTNEYIKPTQKTTFRYADIVEIFDEFVRVVCRIVGKKKDIYIDYHFFVIEKQPATVLTDDQIPGSDSKESNDVNEEKSNKLLSVMVLGLDSVSRLNFHRQMNESVDVLLNELRAIELFGFNKVADNTYPNLIPTLTGLDEKELRDACIRNKNETYDRCHFIWNVFEEKQFATSYVEDIAALALFQYLKQGFKDQPTDYYLRPIFIEMERFIAKQKSSNTYLCIGARRTFDILLEYAQKLVMSLITRPHFSFLWSASYTHDYLNYPNLIDSDFADFLRTLQLTGAFDNLFLVLMSDHGIRWGTFRNTYQGMMEERQPFVYFVPPKWFPEKYPEAMRNLARNRHRLTTPFDLYETFRDLANLDTLESNVLKKRVKDLRETDPMPRGISLFLPVPLSRSCYDAAIASHWCTCHEKAELAPTDPRVSEVARIIVYHLNEIVKPHPMCQQLRLNAVFNANLGTSTNFGNVSNHFIDITVRLQTKPGLGEFEATARVHESHNIELTGTISRTNLYGLQSYCTNDYNLKLYCFCDSVI